MILRVVGPLVLACGLSACAPPVARLPLYAPPAQPSDDQTLADLSRVRSLPLDAPVAIETMDDAAFLGAFHAMVRATGKGGHTGAFWSAFAMSEPSTDVMAMAGKITDDDLGGFYDPRVKRLYVRRRAKPSASGYDRLTLAHEEEHALQDRFFGMPDFSAVADVDESLALRALFEGDATVASVVLDANRKGTSSAEAIARLARLIDDDPLLLRASGVYAAGDVPPLLRAELAWPYVRGSTFVAELAASGGWTLVNAALRNPPKTTEQILHVEKYLAGEGPIDVRAPGAPEGYSRVESGRMGELRTRFFLAQCTRDGGSDCVGPRLGRRRLHDRSARVRARAPVEHRVGRRGRGEALRGGARGAKSVRAYRREAGVHGRPQRCSCRVRSGAHG